MVLFVVVVVAICSFVVGECFGVYVAEKSAVAHSDCEVAHYMRGGFYYIVPERRYLDLDLLEMDRQAERSATGAEMSDPDDDEGWDI